MQKTKKTLIFQRFWGVSNPHACVEIEIGSDLNTKQNSLKPYD
jgi:hypothetical protein